MSTSVLVMQFRLRYCDAILVAFLDAFLRDSGSCRAEFSDSLHCSDSVVPSMPASPKKEIFKFSKVAVEQVMRQVLVQEETGSLDQNRRTE